MVDQDKNFYLVSLGIVITCLLENVGIFKAEVTC